MRKVKKTIFLFLSMFTLTLNVKGAACGYEEKAKLNNEVANVKVNYEIKERVLDKSEYDVPDYVLGTPEEETYVAYDDYFQINLLNLTENMYVVVSNDYDDEVRTYQYSDTDDGNISFDRYEKSEIVNYTFNVYASANTECEDSVVKTFTLKLPRYNVYSQLEICNSIPDYYLCNTYVTIKEISFGTFKANVTKEVEKRHEEKIKEEENNKWYNKIKNYVVEHKTPFIIGGIVLVAIAGGASVVIINKKRRDVL